MGLCGENRRKSCRFRPDTAPLEGIAMKKCTVKEVFSIPNLMGYFRVLLIPVFCWLYLNAETQGDILWAAAVVALSSLTDLFDGMVARKFNMVTDLGKIVDPVADKLTHAALAVCLATRYPLMWLLIGLMVVKESYMAVMGVIFLKKGRMIDGAMWFGKVCTATLFVGMLVLFLFPGFDITVADTLIGFMMIVMLVTFVKYIILYTRMLREAR